MNNTQSTEKFQEFFERAFRGHRIIALPEKGGQRPWDPQKTATTWIDPARPWMSKQPGCKFYFLPGRMKPSAKTNTKDDMMDSQYLWADLDPREGQPLKAERDTMLALLSYELPDNVPTPTFVVDSGRGYWGFWRLKAPHAFDGPNGDATRVFEAVLRGLGNAFGEYGDRSVTNINRIARLPSSINPKTKQRAEVIEFNAVSYSLEDFPSIIVERKPRRVDSEAEPIPTELLEKMLKATPYVGGPKGLDNRRSYDGWLQFAMAVHEACNGDADGLALFTEWCLADPERGYDDADKIQAHWDSFDSEAAGGVTRATWTTLLAFFGNDDIVSDATPSPDAKEDFDADPINEPVTSSTPAIDLEKTKRRIKQLLKNTTSKGRTPEEAATFLAKARQMMAENGLTEDDLKKKKRDRPPTTAKIDDFIAYLPEKKYIFVPTRALWPQTTINSILGSDAASDLDRTRHVAVMAWCPGEDLVIKDRVLVKGGWIDEPGSNTFNLYIAPPTLKPGDAKDVKPWLDHFYKLFPNEADHIIKWLAHRVRYPGIKINHGLIIGSNEQGIGKDSLLEPIVRILGAWNVKDVSAAQSMDEKFNPHLEGLMCRISEANDLGDDDRYSFYHKRKTWMVAPPSTLMITDKHVAQHPVVNVVGVIISANDKAGLFIERPDRRHHVSWSECRQAEFPPEFFNSLYAWYDNGGIENVYAYLMSLDLSDFDPKAPPPKTAAWWEIVNADQSSETSELDDLLDYMDEQWSDERPIVVTIRQLIRAAANPHARSRFDDALAMLQDKRQSKSLHHKLSRAGYEPLQNEADAAEGRWRVAGKRVVIYGRTDVSKRVRLDAARKLINEMFVSDAEQQRREREARRKQLSPA